MSLELVNTLATFGTFVVIAATAIAAIFQLRHARSSNHIAALNELRETQESPHFREASDFVSAALPAKLQDPAFRNQLLVPRARTDEVRPLLAKLTTVGNYYEGMGVLVRTGMVDLTLVMEMFSELIDAAWTRIAPATAIYRRRSSGIYENFEYLAVMAEDWAAAHPHGTYPAGIRRKEIKDEWLEADKQYAASLAPA
jgi:hypothetical protein